MSITIPRIIQDIENANDFDEALLILVQRIREGLDVSACALFLVDRSSQEFVLLATKGFNPCAIGTRVPISHGLLGHIASKIKLYNISHLQQDVRSLLIPDLGEAMYQGFIGVPIVYQRQVYGVITCHKKQAVAFHDREESFLTTLAIAIAEKISQAESRGMISQITSTEPHDQSFYHHGIPSSPGVGIGIGVIVFSPANLDAVPDRYIENAEDIEAQILTFRVTLQAIRAEITELSQQLETNLSPENQALFEAYIHMLDDHSLGFEVEQEIRKGHWAQGALRSVIKAHIREFESMDNAYLRERAEDVRDLGQRILGHLQQVERITPDYPDKMILVGEEVTAANLVGVPIEQLKGIVSARGSSSSHVAILARALGVPAVMGVGDLVLTAAEGETLIVDGYDGQVYLTPGEIILREFQRLAKEEQQLNEELQALQALPAETQDQHTVSLMVNTGLTADLGMSLSVGADGVGLYRTEVPYLTKDMFPSGEEQRKNYRQLLNAFSPRSVVMRTLDIGGDKALPYFTVQESNPFLGWRGIRVTLDHPEIFLAQIRALLLANQGLDNLKILLPMASSLHEIDEAIGLIQQVYNELLAEGITVKMPPVGVMLEVPALVHQLPLVLRRVSFVSVGSNDLTQYLLAVDRNNSRVADLYDSFHPAVLATLNHIVKACKEAGVMVSICGEMAGDPAAVLALVGMGFDVLSMSAARLLRIKWVIRHFHYHDLESLVAEVLKLDHPAKIRERLEQALADAGLGGLIRAGRY